MKRLRHSALAMGVFCACHGAQDTLAARGPQAAAIERLFWMFFWIGLVAFAFVTVWLFLMLGRRKTTELDPPKVTPLPEGLAPPMHPTQPIDRAQDRRVLRVITAASLISLVTLFVMLTASVSTGHSLSQFGKGDPLEVTIIGRQWWWEIHYPNAEKPNLEVMTANELHLPKGRPVRLTLVSHDVIHSFWVPNLHGKRDLIPGYQNSLIVQADELGQFRGQCAEFCGYQHAHMGLDVFVQTEEDFQRWLEEQRAPAPQPLTPEQQRGREVFVNGPCAMCHTIAGTTAAAAIGPNLTHLKSRETIAATTLPNNRGSLAGWVLNAQGVKPGAQMPSLTLPPQDFQALLEYLETLK